MKNITALALCIVFGLVPYALAQTAGYPDGISVSGSAETKARPKLVEIEVRVSAKAELADDAMVKHQQALRTVKEAFAALKMPNLKVIERGISLSPGDSAAQMQAMMRGMQPSTTEKQQLEISSPVRLQLSGIDKMQPADLFKSLGKLLDVARDSGAVIGQTGAESYRNYYYGGQRTSPPVVKFVIRDLDEMREQAYERAMADARRRAERLARLSGVKLGPALSINEVQVSGEQMVYNQYQNQMATAGAGDDPNVGSEMFAEIPFAVKLMVRFAIEKPEMKTAQK